MSTLFSYIYTLCEDLPLNKIKNVSFQDQNIMYCVLFKLTYLQIAINAIINLTKLNFLIIIFCIS